ncbi:MAG: response regulator transcription factor [Hyphomicrobiaceae bacterium]|nr:response regulator transcription factor [Hyphomicrobiaceae bacterium]
MPRVAAHIGASAQAGRSAISAERGPGSAAAGARGPIGDDERQGNRPVAVRVAIADKNAVVRAGLADYIAKDERFTVVDAFKDGGGFIAACEKGRVDIGVIGWTFADMSGGDILDAVKRRQLRARIIVYTGEAAPSVLRQAVRAGAWGFISKADDPAILMQTILAVSFGRISLPYVDINALNEDPLETLTQRERELLRALANGLTNEQIASRIGISQNTVKYHLKNLYDKLGVKNRAMAVGIYLSNGQPADE